MWTRLPSNTYDRLGRLTGVNHATNVTTLAYNDAGQPLSETISGLTTSYAYSSVLLRTNLQMLIGGTAQVTNSYTYDAAGRLERISDGTYSGTYGYHANSSLVDTISLKEGSTERLGTYKVWDFYNRLKEIGSSSSVTPVIGTLYVYNTAGQRSTAIDGDGATRLFTYDSRGQLTIDRKTWPDSGSTPVAGQQFQYGYDDIGNRRWMARGGDEYGANLRYENYTVNNVNQYSQRTVPPFVQVLGSATNIATVTVNDGPTYRKSDYFRKELSVGNSSASVYQGITNVAVLNNGTNSDTVTNITGNLFVPQTPETFAYDADGNLTNDGRWAYTWDGENRLIRLVGHASVPAAARFSLEFGYDAQGRRISKVVSNWTGSAWAFASHTRFAYDGWNLIGELNGTNNAVIRTYMWGTDMSGTMQGAGGVGGLLAINAGTNGMHFTTYDGNGNIVALVNATNGTASARFDYGPFGEPIRAEGAAVASCPIRFSTKYQDGETDFVYYGYRYYNASTGRWLSRDPIEENGGVNLLAFLGNDPIRLHDLLGLSPDSSQDDACCDRSAIDRGENALNYKYARASGYLLNRNIPQKQRPPSKDYNCFDLNYAILKSLEPVPKCWGCNLQHNFYQPGSDRDHWVVICTSRPKPGEGSPKEILFDYWGNRPAGESPDIWFRAEYPVPGAPGLGAQKETCHKPVTDFIPWNVELDKIPALKR